MPERGYMQVSRGQEGARCRDPGAWGACKSVGVMVQGAGTLGSGVHASRVQGGHWCKVWGPGEWGAHK